MPRYFFDVRDGTYYPDEIGSELPGLAAARSAAVTFAGELLRDQGDKFWAGEEWKVEVKDETGLILFTLIFMAVDAAAASPSRAA